jgi:hypothetical protein
MTPVSPISYFKCICPIDSPYVFEANNLPISNLLLWDQTKLVNCKCSMGAFNANYSRQLLKAIGRVNGLVTSDKKVRGKLMLDREAWRSRSRIKMIVAKNIELDASKREDSKVRRVKTRSATVAI